MAHLLPPRVCPQRPLPIDWLGAPDTIHVEAMSSGGGQTERAIGLL